jgi:hypothetical protein
LVNSDSGDQQPKAKAPILCPSARCEEGAYLVGIVGGDGVVGYVTPLLQVDTNFVRSARQGRGPERRFRFAQPCIEGGCANWDGTRCGVIDHALAAKAKADVDVQRGLPRCSIRRWCRWFEQSGPAACSACPLVVTDLPTDRMSAAAANSPA